MLWDPGSQVSLVDKQWVNQYFPDKEILPVADFLEREDLKLCAANNSEIQFEGVILLKFGLRDGEDKFEVPMLVSKSSIAEPILGYNVIEELVLDGGDDDHKLLHACFQSVRAFKIEEHHSFYICMKNRLNQKHHALVTFQVMPNQLDLDSLYEDTI